VVRQKRKGLVQMQEQRHCCHSLWEKPLEVNWQVVCFQQILGRGHVKAKRQSLALEALVQAPVKEKRQRWGLGASIWALATEKMKGRAEKLLVWALRAPAWVPVMAKRKGRARRGLQATPARALVQALVKEKRKGGFLRGLAWVLRGSGLWWEQGQTEKMDWSLIQREDQLRAPQQSVSQLTGPGLGLLGLGWEWGQLWLGLAAL